MWRKLLSERTETNMTDSLQKCPATSSSVGDKCHSPKDDCREKGEKSDEMTWGDSPIAVVERATAATPPPIYALYVRTGYKRKRDVKLTALSRKIGRLSFTI